MEKTIYSLQTIAKVAEVLSALDGVIYYAYNEDLDEIGKCLSDVMRDILTEYGITMTEYGTIDYNRKVY